MQFGLDQLHTRYKLAERGFVFTVAHLFAILNLFEQGSLFEFLVDAESRISQKYDKSVKSLAVNYFLDNLG